MSTLITGGAGFIGSHVAQRLLAEGESVVVLDNFNDYYDPSIKRSNAARLDAYPRATIIEGDIRDADLVQKLFAEHGIKRVAHLAAMAGVRSSVEQARLYMDVNLMGTLNLLETAHHKGVDVFVLASTSSVYGETEQIPFREDDPADRVLAAYPASKRSAEILAHTYTNLWKLNVTALRFFNVYGPSGRPDMMPLRLMQAIASGEEIPIFNGGDIFRDWTYIDDAVNGVIAALNRPMGYEIINLGVGAPISLNDFIEVIEELAGKKANRVDVPTPLSDPPITYCDNSKARHLLDFDPQVKVVDGLAKTWAWFRETYQT
jgi:UDP-glucuronate 4-epimerase